MDIDLNPDASQKSSMTGETMKENSCAENLPLIPLMKRMLPNKKLAEIAQLAKKLSAQKIRQAKSLKLLSKNTIEKGLSGKLNLGEVADVLEVWTALHTSQKGKSKTSRSKKPSQVTSKFSRGKSKSRGKRNRHRHRVTSPRKSSRVCLGDKYSTVKETSPLRTAIMEDNADEVNRLLQLGTNIEERYQNWTPLMFACERGQYCMALLLLQKRADTSAVNKKGRCALSFAAAPSKDDQHQIQRVSQLEIIKLLAEYGAKIDRKDNRRKTPRDHAEEASNHRETRHPCFQRAAAAKLLQELENS